jgi:hypothetical protein
VGVVVRKRLSLRLRLLLLTALNHFSLLSFSHLLIVKWVVSMSARSQSSTNCRFTEAYWDAILY